MCIYLHILCAWIKWALNTSEIWNIILCYGPATKHPTLICCSLHQTVNLLFLYNKLTSTAVCTAADVNTNELNEFCRTVTESNFSTSCVDPAPTAFLKWLYILLCFPSTLFLYFMTTTHLGFILHLTLCIIFIPFSPLLYLIFSIIIKWVLCFISFSITFYPCFYDHFIYFFNPEHLVHVIYLL